MKSILLLILLVMFLPVYSQNKWEETFFGEGSAVSIGMADSNNVYTISEAGILYYLYKSIDQGKTWKLIADDKESMHIAKSISVPDSGNIFLSFDKGKLLKSDDDGKTFTDIILDSVKSFKEIKMYNKDVGILTDVYIIPNISYILITHDGWKTYEKFTIDTNFGNYRCPIFINGSIVYSIVFEFYKKSFPIYLLKLNIKNKEYELNYIDQIYEGIQDLCVINENLLFVCGKSNTLNGGSGHDAIYKSSDGGKNWRRVLDLYSDKTKMNAHDFPPFGLQQIAFKDSLTGIAVGQFGKILYTYNGGESWIYESDLPYYIDKDNPPTMKIRYAGSVPLIADFTGYFHRMTEDNLAPKPEDTLSISGRVWEGGKGQPGIPIALGYRVTMTDSNGYYRFTQLKKETYTVKALNKYNSNILSANYYKPFDYKPLQYDIELSHDTSGFDFNATDLRTYHTISGYVVDNNGKGISGIDVRFARSVITPNGLGLADTITKTDGTGKFEFTNIESYKTWDITPVNDTLKFSPLKHTVRLFTGDTTDLKFTATPTTGVWEGTSPEDAPVLTISPNPAEDYIIIKSSEVFKTSEDCKVQIFDMLGIEVHSESIHPMAGSSRINIGHLQAGMYFIRIGDKTEKFVKM